MTFSRMTFSQLFDRFGMPNELPEESRNRAPWHAFGVRFLSSEPFWHKKCLMGTPELLFWRIVMDPGHIFEDFEQ